MNSRFLASQSRPILRSRLRTIRILRHCSTKISNSPAGTAKLKKSGPQNSSSGTTKSPRVRFMEGHFAVGRAERKSAKPKNYSVSKCKLRTSDELTKADSWPTGAGLSGWLAEPGQVSVSSLLRSAADGRFRSDKLSNRRQTNRYQRWLKYLFSFLAGRASRA